MAEGGKIMKVNKKRISLIASFVILVLVLIVTLCFNIQEEQLSKSEVEQLRVLNGYKTYAIYNENFSYVEISMRTHIERCDTFAYCEVISKPYRVPIYLTEEDKDKNPDQLPKLLMYDIKIIKDSEGIYEKGAITNFAYGRANQANAPTPKVGEKIIIPITLGEPDSTAENYAGFRGYYYITDEGFGISAFEEEPETYYSGKTAENIIKSLKKTDAEREAYLAKKNEMYEKSGGKYGFTSIEMLREQIKEKLEAKKNAEK